ncbi:MAG: hypothetical protein ACI9S8_002801 [Chlamydiales bacterium]|jgi:hypothetical protein
MESPDKVVNSAIQRRQSTLLSFLDSPKKDGAQSLTPSQAEDDSLMQLASKQRSDTVKFTYFFLKNRISTDLDSTISNHVKKHPEMKGKFFVAILTGQSLNTEVVDLDTAAKNTVDLPEEEAREVLKKNPVGYFNAEDFKMKTSEEPAFGSLKKKIDDFFQENSAVFTYLREHPEHNLSAEDFYKPPS